MRSHHQLQVGLYTHYKGGKYLMIGIARHTETDEDLVVYVSLAPALPGPRLRVRPLNGPEGWLTPVNNSEGMLTDRFIWSGNGT